MIKWCILQLDSPGDVAALSAVKPPWPGATRDHTSFPAHPMASSSTGSHASFWKT